MLNHEGRESTPHVSLKVVDSIADLDEHAWNRLTRGNPFLNHAFLAALHDCGCASAKSGWLPRYILLERGGALEGAMPLYVKTHSRGEYVFDQAWANAFEQNGLRYYPKLVGSVPFTPVSGPRLLAANRDDRLLLARAAVQLASDLDVSSLHVLFPDVDDTEVLREAGYLMREGVQFHWDNDGYASFDAFLASMSQQKRKKMKQDKKRVLGAGIAYHWLRGAAITGEHLAFFYRCYEATYRSHWSAPYLTPSVFRRMHEAMPESMVLFVAERDGEPLACALNVIGGDVMYGRYWGTLEYVSGLHFETCYGQSIEFCIAHRIARFEGGAQGEHKMSRGLLPTRTWSGHWVADQRFAAAIEHFLEQETASIEDYVDELETRTPFKAATGQADDTGCDNQR
jgi:predicted N-acyltransferase